MRGWPLTSPATQAHAPDSKQAPLEAGAGPLSERRHARDWGHLADLERKLLQGLPARYACRLLRAVAKALRGVGKLIARNSPATSHCLRQ